MNRRRKKLLLSGFILLIVLIAVALGMKYFPFTKVLKMHAEKDRDLAGPEQSGALPPNALFYNFELEPGKPLPDRFYKGMGHSGQYSVKAFGQNSFSPAIERTAEEIGFENLKSVAVSAWVYVFPTSNKVQGHLVFTASNEVGVNVCWQGVSVHEPDVPRGKWFKVSGEFDLSSLAFKPGFKVQVYFWNNSRSDILVDDYYVVFGGARERRGDSTLADMTAKNGYAARLNFPPFPVSFLVKEATNRLPGPAEIGPDDQVIAGKFFNTPDDGLFILRKDGKPAAFADCPDAGGFRKVAISDPAVMARVTPVTRMLKGRFLDGTQEQLLLAGKKGWILAGLDVAGSPCSSGDIQGATLKLLWKSDTPAASLVTGDFNGDRRTEILEVGDDGSWTLLAFEKKGNAQGSMRTIAGGEHNPVKQWDRAGKEISLSPGRFHPAASGDQVLTIMKNKADGKCTYTILAYNTAWKRWECLYPEKQDRCGRTIGLDTLRPGDVFFPLSNGEAKGQTFFRYNRDWRFDLKEIRFNDSSFTIRSMIDFSGYELDHNPKYYESLKLIPGHFSGTSEITFLVAGHVAGERHYEAILPDFTGLYSIPRNK